MKALSLLPLLLVLLDASAHAAERVRFATNWRAQAEHGGYYHALAEGLYEERGLDVELIQGGPMVNGRAQLAAGRIDFLIASNLVQSFDNVRNGLPTVTVAAIFQRDPHCLIAHPGVDRWEDLPGKTFFVGNAGRHTYFRWLKKNHGFSDRNTRTYAFNSAPFLVNKDSIQQGYATAEPYAIEKALGEPPEVHLLADHGWSTYSTMLDTRRDLVEEKPDLVRRFVDASVLGWVGYLYGDPTEANRLIQEDNPQMSDGQLAYSRRQMIGRGIVDSGDALTDGVGALNPQRIADFLRKMVDAGLYEPGEVDPTKGYDARFVNHGVGLAEKQRLLGSKIQ